MTDAPQPPSISQPERDRAVPECPYVGLVPFDESDAPYFFGRQRECEVIVANLTAARLTLFYAASGVGKSSVLRAGVLPRFQEIAEESYADLGVPDTAVAYIREWSPEPLNTIATAVLEAVSRTPGADPVEVPGPPRLSVPWLREVLQRSGVAAVCLILDQFEEYFRYHPDDHGENGLAAELGHLLSARDLQVNVLLSIREDELAALDRLKGRVPRLYDNYLRLAHLGRADAREAIEGPLDHYNQVVSPNSAMTIQPELTETLLDQVRARNLAVAPDGAVSGEAADGPDDIATPYLQLVLHRLWEVERASGSSVLRRGTLDELGGAKTIVETHLRTVMAKLSPQQQEVAAAVFHHLVTPSGSKIALTAEDLADYSGVPVSWVRELLESLSAGRQRIVRPVPPPAGVPGPRRYEIFHDVMGPAVLDWRRLHVAQREQEEASSKLIAEREAARAEAQATGRRLHQTRLLAAGLVVVLLIACALGGYSYFANRKTEQRRLLSEAAAALGEDPVQSLRKAVEADGIIKGDDEAREAVLTAASAPRSRVIAGPPSESSAEPRVVGMVVTPDQRHVVTYDAQGGIRVIGDDGQLKEAQKVSHLAGTVVKASTSPSAAHVALATDRGSAVVIEVGTGAQVDLATDGSPVSAVRWLESSPDNLVLVVTSSGVAATYSATTGRQVAHFPDTVYQVLPTADAQVVTSNRDLRLRVWDARTATMAAESSPLSSGTVYLRRYGREVVGLTVDGNIIRWDWRAKAEPRQWPFFPRNDFRQVAVNEDAHTVTIALDKEVRTFSLDDGLLQRMLPQQPDWVNDVALDPRDQWIATAGADGRVRVWSGKKDSWIPNRATYEFIGHRSAVQSVSYLGDGKSLISLGSDGTVRLWDVSQIQRFDLHKSWVTDLDMSPDGRWFATASYDGVVHIVDPAGASNPPVATIEVSAVGDVRFDPTDPHRIFTRARYNEQPQGWRWDSGRGAERLPEFEAPPVGPADWLVSLDISRDGKRVAAGDTHGNIYLWDAHTGKLIGDHVLTGSGQGVSGIAFDTSGRLLAATGRDEVLLKKLGTEEEPKRLPLPDATTVAFDPRGEHIVGGAGGGVLRVWTRDGRLVHDLVAHGGIGGNPSFSGDGKLVAVGTSDGLIEVWNVHSGRRVLLVRHHGDLVNDVLFLPVRPGDQSRLVSASDDSTVAVFRCKACENPDAVIQDAKRWVHGSN